MKTTVGVSILTNGNRLSRLKRSVDSLLENCSYRPLCIGIFDNGSTDGTKDWTPPEVDGVEYKIVRSEKDLGCSIGTNKACDLVSGCQYALHLESDFELLPESLTGQDDKWLDRAIDFMDEGGCDYLYLRKITNEDEMLMHFWSQWMPKITEEKGEYLRCPDFWFSQNPHIRRNSAMSGVLPVPEFEGDNKSSDVWNKSEMETGKPPNAWIHRFGLFVHEWDSSDDLPMGCGRFSEGASTCKYGWFKSGSGKWCDGCDLSKGFRDMHDHDMRFRGCSVGEVVEKSNDEVHTDGYLSLIHI